MKGKIFQKKLVLQILVAIVGLMICGVGVGIFLYSQLGVDPASVLQLGLGNVFHVSYGTASALSNIVILFIVFIVDKSYINLSSLLAIFGIGYTADFVSFLLDFFIKGEPGIAIRILMILIGCLIMAVGIATYIRAGLGVGAIDMVSEVISNKLKFSYRIVRVVCDITFVVVGYLLGGIVGVGTVVAAFMTGPAVQFVRPYVYKVTDKVLRDSRG
ncbi:YczE/YyaS/YitT family protein [Kineothrix sp. MB12-C1]|uniref:YczE/YyaS/YitT family protein n=1 Tax=Kineothrix sp. MB12-C1 TaxID=3070215 RepID=UPI0027D309A7|nr:YitT family protein [Kineothrix sp. MB12-C1]WMC93773.1 YitT family protein [Kineothrix sp. MB12-C1]